MKGGCEYAFENITAAVVVAGADFCIRACMYRYGHRLYDDEMSILLYHYVMMIYHWKGMPARTSRLGIISFLGMQLGFHARISRCSFHGFYAGVPFGLWAACIIFEVCFFKVLVLGLEFGV